MNSPAEISPSTQLLLDEIRRRFDEFDARMERRFSRTLTALEQRGATVELRIGGNEQFDAKQLVVADNWGGLFDGAGDSMAADTDAPVVADNWGGLFDEIHAVVPALGVISTDFDAPAHVKPAPSVSAAAEDEADALQQLLEREYKNELVPEPLAPRSIDFAASPRVSTDEPSPDPTAACAKPDDPSWSMPRLGKPVTSSARVFPGDPDPRDCVESETEETRQSLHVPEFAPQTSVRIHRGGTEFADLSQKLGLNGAFHRFEYGVPAAAFLATVRRGTCSTAHPDPPDTVVHRAISVRDDMLLAASEVLAEQVTEEHFAKGLTFPNIRAISACIVARVAAKANELVLDNHLPCSDDLVKHTANCMYTPANCSTKCLGGAVDVEAPAAASAVAMVPVIIFSRPADTFTAIDVLPVCVEVLDVELLKCGDWVEEQPWPPPHVQVGFRCGSAAVRPSHGHPSP